MLKLYSYFRSSASYRVRLALHWKELKFEYLPVHLIKEGGQQHKPDFRKINPMGHVPALEHDGFYVAESVAIIDYLDQMFPQKRLFPLDPRERATVMQICEIVNSGIQPLQNLKLTQALEKEFAMAKSEAQRFHLHWIVRGLDSLERVLEKTAGTYSFGGEVTAADCFIIPQLFSARRFGAKTENYPCLSCVEANAVKLPAFERAHPDRQPDSEK